jgi:nanoRNase/pAp phosphatase (c-di-AMP/oligoRNAs hydrolase)
MSGLRAVEAGEAPDLARLARLVAAATRAGRILIQPHDNPDADAIASSVAFLRLVSGLPGVEAGVAYHGYIGRAENRALVRLLDEPLHRADKVDPAGWRALALVDTQPGAGNLTPVVGLRVAIVFDRQEPGRLCRTVEYVDARPELGATSTMLTQYLRTSGMTLDQRLASALFYGIKSNTLALSRDASPEDAAAYAFLQRQLDATMVNEIEYARVPADYFQSFDRALASARCHNGLLVAYAGELSYPDLAAELADLLLRLEQALWVICSGCYGDHVVVSVRTRLADGEAERVARAIAGAEGAAGGRGTMAGGRIPLEGRSPERVATTLERRALHALGFEPDEVGEQLL